MKTVLFGCGHTQTYERILPPPRPESRDCPPCRTSKVMAMGMAHSERVRREKREMATRATAERRHNYGRPHDQAVCPLCGAGAGFRAR